MQSDQILRYGAYICLRLPAQRRQKIANAPVPALAERLRLTNEFAAGEGHPADAIAFLRRIDATPAHIADDELLRADALVHVASATAATVAQFCSGLADLLLPGMARYVLRGVVRPTNFTGNAMHEFA